MNFGAFILPNVKLEHEIMFWKGLVESNCPDQFYTKHLPHLTILNIKVKDINIALKKSIETINEYNSFQIRIEKKGVFWNDFGTHGGHTLFYEVKKNQYILNLQKVLAESLTSEVIREEGSIYKEKGYEMDLSYKKYGSPFIGEQWIPHFSIASLNKDVPLGASLFSRSELLSKFVFISQNLGDLVSLVANYGSHLKSIYKLEQYYQ